MDGNVTLHYVVYSVRSILKGHSRGVIVNVIFFHYN